MSHIHVFETTFDGALLEPQKYECLDDLYFDMLPLRDTLISNHARFVIEIEVSPQAVGQLSISHFFEAMERGSFDITRLRITTHLSDKYRRAHPALDIAFKSHEHTPIKNGVVHTYQSRADAMSHMSMCRANGISMTIDKVTTRVSLPRGGALVSEWSGVDTVLADDIDHLPPNATDSIYRTPSHD